MKIRQKVFLRFLFLAVIIIFSLVFLSYKISRNFLEKNIQEHLLSVAKNKANWVNTYFAEKKADLFTLTECPLIKNLLNEKVTSDLNFAQKNLQTEISSINHKIENFLNQHSTPDLNELKRLFTKHELSHHSIVVYEPQTGTVYFQSNDKFANKDKMYLQENLIGNNLFGEYSYINDRGITKDRVIIADVLENKKIVCSVSKDIDRSVSFTVNLERSNYLRNFIKSYEYENLVLFTWDGQLVWMCKNRKMLQTNVSFIHYKDSLLSNIYEQVHKSEKTILSDISFCSDMSSIKPVILIGAPVYFGEDQDPLGIIAIQLSITQINNIMQDRTGLGRTGETYIVGADGLMRSDSRFFKESTILQTKVVTDATSYYFSNLDNSERIKKNFSKSKYKDYRGIDVLGSGMYLPDMNWILLAEIDFKEAFYPLQKLLTTLSLGGLIVIFFTLIVSVHFTHILTKPVINLHQGVDIIRKGNLEHRVDVSSDDEIGELTFAFNEMNEARKHNEKELQDKQKSLTALINNIPGIAYRGIHDKNRTMHFISSGCYSLTGYTNEEVSSGKISFSQIIHPEDRQNVWNTIETELKKEKSFEIVYRIYSPKKQIKWIWEKGVGIFENNVLVALEGLIIDITDRKNIQNTLNKYSEKLEKTKIALEQKNILLVELLEQIEAEKARIKEEILTNINKFILPTVDKLKHQSNPIDSKYLNILTDSLKNITSSMGLEISKMPNYKLAPREIEICLMIKSGLSTKEISKTLHISRTTVERYRNNIRKKLGLVKTKVNLFTYLQEIS